APVAVLCIRTRPVVVLALLGLLSLLLAFGSPLYALFFFGIPGVDQLHTPFRWIYPYSLAATTLASVGAQALARGAPTWLRRLGVLAAAVGGLGVLANAAIFVRPGRATNLAQSLVDRSSRLKVAFADGDGLLSYEWRNLTLFALFLGLSGLAMWAIARWPRRGLGLGALVLVADLFV